MTGKITLENKDVRAVFDSFMPRYMTGCFASNPGRYPVYAETGENTAAAMVNGHTVYIGGAVTEAFAREIADIFMGADGWKKFNAALFVYDTDATRDILRTLFNGRKMFDDTYNCYKCSTTSGNLNMSDEPSLPSEPRRIDRALMSSGAPGLSVITDEVISTGTYADFDDFLERGFGYTVLDGGEVCGFCTSEYPCPADGVNAPSVAVGIEVAERLRRRGWAKAMTRAFIKEAAARGLDVYWDAWEGNEASNRTALSCGFKKIFRYRKLVVYLG